MGLFQACSVDFEKCGYQEGMVQFAAPSNDSGYGKLMLPISVFKAERDGPTLFLAAGCHGDEYEGQYALYSLIEHLRQKSFRLSAGRIIIMPSLNLPAAVASTRFSPVDGGNLNSAYTRVSRGLTQTIGTFLEKEILSRSDYFFDIHSGGTSMEYVPIAIGYYKSRNSISGEMIDVLKAFATPFVMLREAPEMDSFSFHAAARENCIYLSAELGGSASLNRKGVALALQCIDATIKKLGLTTPAKRPAAKQTWVEVSDTDAHLVSPEDGIFLHEKELAARVKKDALAGKLYRLGFNENHIPLTFPSDGLLLAKRAPAKCRRGDCLAEIGRIVDTPSP